MFPIFPTDQEVARLAAFKTSKFPIAPNAAQFKLFVNSVTPDVNSTIATFTEATTPGYTARDVIMNAPDALPSGLAVCQSGTILNDITGTNDPPESAYGYFVTNQAGDELIFAENFSAPILLETGTRIFGVCRISQPNTNYGWVDLAN